MDPEGISSRSSHIRVTELPNGVREARDEIDGK